MGEIVRIDQKQLKMMKGKRSSLDQLNSKLQAMRERQLFSALQEGTIQRVELMKKAQKWIDLLEQRLFDPTVIQELPIKTILAIFKYVGGLSVKMLGQTNDLEKIFKTYLESNMAISRIQNEFPSASADTERDAIKKQLMGAFAEMFKASPSVVNAEVVKPQSASDASAKVTEVASDGVVTEVASDVPVDPIEQLLSEIPGLLPPDPMKDLPENLDVVPDLDEPAEKKS